MDTNDPNPGPALSPTLDHQEIDHQIKTLIVSLMLSASPRIQSQLKEILAVIGKHDFPKSRASGWLPFQPPSLAKHIKFSLEKRLRRMIGVAFGAKYEFEKELGRGLSGVTFSVRDETLKDISGTYCYMAPEVLRRCHSLEADIWSIGVITYYLLSGCWPFLGYAGSEIFQSQEESDPNFDDSPWPSISPEAKDFVKRLLNKNHIQRMTAAEALTHPWLHDESRAIPLDISIYMSIKLYLHLKPHRCAAQKALSKALTEDELVYLRAQFRLLEPNSDGSLSLENFKMALARNASNLMDESWVPDTLSAMGSLANRKMYFDEFCAAAIHLLHLEGVEGWEQIVSTAFEHFEQEGNQVISDEEFCQELNISGPEALSYVQDGIRNSDGKLNLIGFTKLLHGSDAINV
ncbi:hypothetical protein CCACVL1_21941 [Corchorus capsularis]|uniref:non-specific serine/threonine protein kinase n=1 Tax=Corchorus capsularis TaxID=210143 RepID=A0A1R3H1H2_COCAP|nr:hypothetical protein CCACVL1_21941 [Corchorus capsularis]